MGKPSSVGASESPAINPVLASALGSMDVQLEQELARYRRKRSETESPSRPQDSYPQLSIHSTIPANGQSETLGETAAILPLPSQTEAEPEREIVEPNDEAHSPQISLIASPDIPSEEAAESPNDYLESSEQLLRNLEEKEEPPQPKSPSPTLAERLLTPLGIGSILLLFGTATLVGAALLDPEMVSSWSVARLFNGKKSASVDQAPSIAANPEAEGPKLETDEFVELDLDTLSTIEPSPAASPNPNASPVPPTNPTSVPPVTLPEDSSNLTRALIPPTQPQQTSSAVPAETAPPVPTKITPAPAPSSGDRHYFAIADYTGPESLQQVQAVIPDAYVRNFGSGASIQLGAFLNQGDAERLAEKLEQEGISASVYHR